METNNLKLPQSPDHLHTDDGEKFVASLSSPEVWTQIPLINYTPIHQLRDLSVVRFRGMIQDMPDPEIYLERYEIIKKSTSANRLQEGKYRDCVVVNEDEEINFDSEANVQGERRSLFVISIPGINKWTEDYEQQCNLQNMPQLSMEESQSTNASRKRAASDCEKMDVDIIEGVSPIDIQNKRQCTLDKLSCHNTNCTTTGSALGADVLLNSPIPDRPSKACMVKIYKGFDSYKLNTMIDVVGFISLDPALDASTMEFKDCDNVNELRAQNPPPSLIPRLHAIAVHKLSHPNPLLDARLTLPATDNLNTYTELNMISIRKDLRMLLTLCLFHDELAADYLLSHLISTVYCRSEMQSIGKFTLNICNLPKEVISDYTIKLYEILEMLMPASHYLPMTLDKMNSTAFAPKKNYETNKLVSGLLQLAPHTHLVLDETRMQQGKLESNGVLGLQSIAYLIKQQQIKCNFQYYEIDYDVDIPVLVLSEGRSMLPQDFAVPVKADKKSVELITETLKAARHYLQQADRLNLFRIFLTKAKICEFDMKPEESEMIQTDFVEMRKANAINSVDDLHALLVLSRLLAVSCGKEMLDKESWQLAKEMEVKRRQRVQELPQSNRINTN